MNIGNRISCPEFFKKIKHSPTTLTVRIVIIVRSYKYIDEFTTNSEVHTINTQHRSDLHPLSINLTKYQEGVYYAGI